MLRYAWYWLRRHANGGSLKFGDLDVDLVKLALQLGSLLEIILIDSSLELHLCLVL